MPGKIMMIARMVRLPNLLIIILTMFLIRYSIFLDSLYAEYPEALSPLVDFSLLVLATILLAAGGYVINDYFDVGIDRINKPEAQIIPVRLSAKTAMKIHIILNVIAVLIGFYLGYRIEVWSFAMIFPVIAVMLWFYSARYKRILFWGNFVIALLSALVLIIVWLWEFFWLRQIPGLFSQTVTDLRWVTRLVLLYAAFAFLTSFIREIVKDIEDQQGDSAFGCRTFPVVLGEDKTRWILIALTFATMVLLFYYQLILWRLNLTTTFWFLMITVQLPLLVFAYRVVADHREPGIYKVLSVMIKVVMVAGILSMQLLSLTF